MQPLAQLVQEFNDLVEQFDYEKAHDRFYHPELVKHENEDAPTIGLKAHRQEMHQFLDNISDYSARPLNTLLSEDISVTEWHYQFKHKEWGDRDFRELSIQRWRDGKIVHERHLYKTESW